MESLQLVELRGLLALVYYTWYYISGFYEVDRSTEYGVVGSFNDHIVHSCTKKRRLSQV